MITTMPSSQASHRTRRIYRCRRQRLLLISKILVMVGTTLVIAAMLGLAALHL